MERAIPETYTYNICAYRASQGPDNKFAEKAMTLLPDDISDRGYDAVLGYLWMMGETDGTGWKAGLFNDILRRQYEHGKYPSFILRFGYNQLQGMAEGGLFSATATRSFSTSSCCSVRCVCIRTRWWS